MPTPAEQLRTLVEEVISPLVDNPSELQVTASEEDSDVLVEIVVDPDDAGKVIGRQGRVIKSIRTLARAAATRKGLNVVVELLDD